MNNKDEFDNSENTEEGKTMDTNRYMGGIKRILVVEDDPDIGSILVDLFNDLGYQAICADNANQALDYIEHQPIDMVTLDLRLPDMSGNDLLRELARQAFSKPVVVISANLENLRPHPLVKQALGKPFDVSNLVKVVNHYV